MIGFAGCSSCVETWTLQVLCTRLLVSLQAAHALQQWCDGVMGALAACIIVLVLVLRFGAVGRIQLHHTNAYQEQGKEEGQKGVGDTGCCACII